MEPGRYAPAHVYNLVYLLLFNLIVPAPNTRQLMNNEIVKTNQEAIELGKVFFDSGLFTDLKNAQSAVVKVIAGREFGIPPFAAMAGIHVIQGKPVIGAGLMASRIKASGKYDYRVVKLDGEICEIQFLQGKDKIGVSTFTIDDARKAQTKNLEKFPKNMLFARAISNGVKWFCPDIYDGPVYVPEEMEVQTEDIKAEVVATTPTPEAQPEGVLPESVYLDWIAEAQTIEALTALKAKIPAKGWTKKTIKAATEQHAVITQVAPIYDPNNL